MESFDYVIVGAGSAGCVLANRLSHDGSTRVLLLEAGGEDDAPPIHIPALFATLYGTERDWAYSTVPQKHTGNSVYVPRGRMLGGSSSMNAMIYVRGNPADYDRWRDDFGAEGWGYTDVLPYFVRAEDNARLAGPLHGVGGPLRVEDQVFTHELSQAWVDSAVNWGLPRNDDFNGESQLGAGFYQLTCRNGTRWSAADAYLRPALGRPNLTIRTHSLATRLLMDGARVTGVVYVDGDGEHTVMAEGEVLLSAGTIASPQLLMLSGIGPAPHLREHGIEVRVALSGVGANLHDHPTASVAWSTRGSTDLFDLISSDAAMRQWQSERRGPLASNIAEAGAFLSTGDGVDAPDIQVHAGATAFYSDGLDRPETACFTAQATAVNPRSRGRVSLRSTDPHDDPWLDFAFYESPADFKALLFAQRALIEISRFAPLATFLDESLLLKSAAVDSELAEHTRRRTQSLYHPVGTCAMGVDEDAVVDASLRVYGVDGLRVVDASVMPAITRGNTNAPTIMIAEKAAALLSD